MISSLEERLLDIEYTVDIEHRDKVEGDILEQVNVVLIIVEHTVQEFVNDVEGHLDRDSLSCVVSACDKHGRSLLGRLRACLKFNQRDLTTFV